MSRLSPAASPANVVSSTGQVPCPRCRSPLVDPSGLGWCKGCGYCRSLADTEKKVIAETRPSEPPQLYPAAKAGYVPRWCFVMLIGVVLIAGATYAGGRYLTLNPLERAMLTTLQIGFGLFVMFMGQFIGLLRIAPEEASLSFKDAIVPLRLYGFVFKRLPKAAVTVYGGSWGLTAIIAAVVCIGGLGHWFTYIPSNQKNNPHQSYKARSR